MSGAVGRPLPEALEPLRELALDLRWTWSRAADPLWRHVSADHWERTGSPWLTLQLASAARLEALAADPVFLAELAAHHAERRRQAERRTWFDALGEPGPGLVAYFSMEFALHESLPLYAGGLGVLAGDHLKTASDLGVPLVGVGILWQQGYFRQLLDERGGQLELYPHNESSSLPLRPVLTPGGEAVEVALELPGRPLRLRAWTADVGGVPLYLLDGNHPLNDAADRGITATLYSADSETRLLQELVLGIAGWRLLRALGLPVEVCHLNEGHAAFVVIERIRSFMQDEGVSFREALWATRAGNVFTTHTPVEAGFDAFTRPLIDRYTQYFAAYVERLGIGWPELLALGRRASAGPDEPFGMAYLALSGCSRAGGVSARHGEVSRRLFQSCFPRIPEREVPLAHVTNGVHVPTWESREADALWTTAAGKGRWQGALEGVAEAVHRLGDEDLWALRCAGRRTLVERARGRLRRQLARRGPGAASGAELERVLDAEALTLGFARRFTAYKRPNLLLLDVERLRRLLCDAARPVQLLIAGKAHPADGEGKRLLAEWVRLAEDPALRRHLVFLEDYDLALARELVQGVDVWINTPRPPLEACGTSGMKVLANGGLNLSVRDGWWAEAGWEGSGWTVEAAPGGAGGDRADAEALYRLLEQEVVPLFYRRDASGLPREWTRAIRRGMATLAPRFSSNRMLREYVTELYGPAARDLRARVADGARVARELADWEARLAAAWPGVGFEWARVDAQGSGRVAARARVRLGGLPPADVRVELYAEPEEGEPGAGVREPMTLVQDAPDGEAAEYAATFATVRPPAHFTARVVPSHAHARLPLELALVVWAT